MNLKSKLLCGIDFSQLKGLEIGPLTNPMVQKSEGPIYYMDRSCNKGIAEWYAGDDIVDPDTIVNIDYIWGKHRFCTHLPYPIRKGLKRLGIGFNTRDIQKSVGLTQKFDYCIANHVVEHVPDMISWLQQIAAILKTGGICSLAVPDKRYTFDCKRRLTTLADLVDAYLRKADRPSPRHIFEHYASQVNLDIEQAWSPDFDCAQLPLKGNDNFAWAACLEATRKRKYVDTHCWVFTADSFIDLLERLNRLGLLDYKLSRFFKVDKYAMEFVVHLEKLPPDVKPKIKYQAFQESLKVIRQSHEIRINLKTSKAGEIQVYYDYGFGFSEQDSIKTSIDHAHLSQTVILEVPPVPFNKIRFDTNMGRVQVGLTSIAVCYHQTNLIKVPFSEISPFNEIKSMEIRDNTLNFTTLDSPTDPSVLIKIPKSTSTAAPSAYQS